MKKLKSLEIPGTGYKFFMDNAECAPNALEKIQSLINSLTEEAKELKSEATKDNTAKIQCLNLASYCLYQVSKTLIKGNIYYDDEDTSTPEEKDSDEELYEDISTSASHAAFDAMGESSGIRSFVEQNNSTIMIEYCEQTSSKAIHVLHDVAAGVRCEAEAVRKDVFGADSNTVKAFINSALLNSYSNLIVNAALCANSGEEHIVITETKHEYQQSPTIEEVTALAIKQASEISDEILSLLNKTK